MSNSGDAEKQYKNEWNNITNNLESKNNYVAFRVYETYDNYVSIKKKEDKRENNLLYTLFFLWGLLGIYILYKEAGSSRADDYGKGDYLRIMFWLFVLWMAWAFASFGVILNFFPFPIAPNGQRRIVWLKYGISCPKCLKLAEPINKSRNNYTCHNPDCDLKEFANIAHNVNRYNH